MGANILWGAGYLLILAIAVASGELTGLWLTFVVSFVLSGAWTMYNLNKL